MDRRAAGVVELSLVAISPDLYRACDRGRTVGWLWYDSVGWVASVGNDVETSAWVGRRFELTDAAALLVSG